MLMRYTTWYFSYNKKKYKTKIRCYNRELVIRLLKENYKNKNVLSLVLARRRSKAGLVMKIRLF
jgi:hypothetical protein